MNPPLPVLWLFGLPSSGKTTLSRALRDRFTSAGRQVGLLDGDELRHGLCSDLGFSDEDRAENLRRAAEMAKLLSSQGMVVICAFITPKEHHRTLVRNILPDVCLIHVNCPLDICVTRDVKGLYRKAAAKVISGMTGTQEQFAPPEHFDLALDSHAQDVESCVQQIITSPRLSAFHARGSASSPAPFTPSIRS